VKARVDGHRSVKSVKSVKSVNLISKVKEFNFMNYQRIYRQLIEHAMTRKYSGFTETHHVIPRCMSGTDDPENLVELTPEEHYLAHQLLVKIYPESHSLLKAAMMMRPQRPSNKLYGWLRRRYAESQSKAQAGQGNNRYGTKWIHNPELRQSKSVDKNILIENGWFDGRVIDWDAYSLRKERMSQRQLQQKKESKAKKLKKIKSKHYAIKNRVEYRKAKAHKIYKEFVRSDLSLRDFAKSKNLVAMTLSNWFNEFIQEYDIIARKRANKQLGGCPGQRTVNSSS